MKQAMLHSLSRKIWRNSITTSYQNYMAQARYSVFHLAVGNGSADTVEWLNLGMSNFAFILVQFLRKWHSLKVGRKLFAIIKVNSRRCNVIMIYNGVSYFCGIIMIDHTVVHTVWYARYHGISKGFMLFLVLKISWMNSRCLNWFWLNVSNCLIITVSFNEFRTRHHSISIFFQTRDLTEIVNSNHNSIRTSL